MLFYFQLNESYRVVVGRRHGTRDEKATGRIETSFFLGTRICRSSGDRRFFVGQRVRHDTFWQQSSVRQSMCTLIIKCTVQAWVKILCQTNCNDIVVGRFVGLSNGAFFCPSRVLAPPAASCSDSHLIGNAELHPLLVGDETTGGADGG